MAAKLTAHTVCCRNLLRELAFQHEGAFNYAVRRIVLPNATISLPVATLQTDAMDDRPRWELQLATIFA
ncbi:hypothetical protein [Stenomitos frigidus]|uniref:hypothetical protein n=1 Tax=Stenomitos frigidus TaxID=1886765 RepID=UPI001C62C14D|nr:hypothetical protein [Stenomitos frigidus]